MLNDNGRIPHQRLGKTPQRATLAQKTVAQIR